MTERFDRTADGKKCHMQSLAALRNFDYNDPSRYSYEHAIDTITRISSNADDDFEQQFLRTVFNVIARSQDDHVKNIAFYMDTDGTWGLSPAFDLIYAWNPNGLYTHCHQMSMNGKRDNFEPEDFLSFARTADIKPMKAKALYEIILNWRICYLSDELQVLSLERGRR